MLQINDSHYYLDDYGLFLRDIPRRLWNPQALDTAVEALEVLSPFLPMGSFQLGALIFHG